MINGTRKQTDGSSLRILGFESYDSGSHRSVRELISEFSRHEWRWATRPGRAWNWRMRIGAAELVAQMHSEQLLHEAGGQWKPDAVFATSLLSVGDLRGLLPGDISSRPFLLYMHENQIAYPVRTEYGAGGERDLQYPITNLMSLLAADRVAWNSSWNLESFCGGIDELIGHCPDHALVDVEDDIRSRSSIIWPPVCAHATPGAVERVLHNSPVVVWPHRWEHDKNPEGLLDTARRAREAGHCLRWILLGRCSGPVPEAMTAFHDEFGTDIVHSGWVESREEYWSLLQQADWVLSTARHEFFGIAVAEAMLAGCLPWLPDRLSYPEITPRIAHGLSPMNPPDDMHMVRKACIQHMAPCAAAEAVGRLDQQLDRMVCAQLA